MSSEKLVLWDNMLSSLTSSKSSILDATAFATDCVAATTDSLHWLKTTAPTAAATAGDGAGADGDEKVVMAEKLLERLRCQLKGDQTSRSRRMALFYLADSLLQTEHRSKHSSSAIPLLPTSSTTTISSSLPFRSAIEKEGWRGLKGLMQDILAVVSIDDRPAIEKAVEIWRDREVLPKQAIACLPLSIQPPEQQQQPIPLVLDDDDDDNKEKLVDEEDDLRLPELPSGPEDVDGNSQKQQQEKKPSKKRTSITTTEDGNEKPGYDHKEFLDKLEKWRWETKRLKYEVTEQPLQPDGGFEALWEAEQRVPPSPPRRRRPPQPAAPPIIYSNGWPTNSQPPPPPPPRQFYPYAMTQPQQFYPPPPPPPTLPPPPLQQQQKLPAVWIQRGKQKDRHRNKNSNKASHNNANNNNHHRR